MRIIDFIRGITSEAIRDDGKTLGTALSLLGIGLVIATVVYYW